MIIGSGSLSQRKQPVLVTGFAISHLTASSGMSGLPAGAFLAATRRQRGYRPLLCSAPSRRPRTHAGKQSSWPLQRARNTTLKYSHGVSRKAELSGFMRSAARLMMRLESRSARWHNAGDHGAGGSREVAGSCQRCADPQREAGHSGAPGDHHFGMRSIIPWPP